MRNDGVARLYLPSQWMDKLSSLLFVLNFICVIMACFLSDVPLRIAVVFQIIFSLAFVIIDILDNGVFWFNAENARRINSIQNAFQVNLSEYTTEGYYNNEMSPSFLKYALNTFESHFFTIAIAQKMLAKKIVEVIAAIVLFIISCLCISFEVTAIVAEAIFSSSVMIDAVSFIIYEIRMKQLYDKAYTQFVSVGIMNSEQIVWLLSYILEYEAIKAHYRIRLDEKIFVKLNPTLSDKWNKLQDIIVLPDEVNKNGQR
jgi:ABC-type multidrug transport system fused ATPase/permease subunit